MYGYASSVPLPYRGFEIAEYWSMFTFDFIMNYNENSHIGYILMIDGNHPVHL